MLCRLNIDMKKDNQTTLVKCTHENGLVVLHMGEHALEQAEDRKKRFEGTMNPVVEMEIESP